MKAVVFPTLGAIDNGAVVEIADPVPGDEEVVVEIHAAPVNYVDLVTMTGRYQFTPSLPYTPGKGPAGVIARLGSAVRGLRVGDRVLAMAEYGGYAEQVAVDQRQVYELADGMSFVDAASMSLAFDTAWMALRERARLHAGETVLVLGASGAVGCAAVQLAKAMGASTVLAGVTSADKAAAAIRAGADATIDVGSPNPRDDIRDQVSGLTGGIGVDVVIDPVGGDPFDGAVRCLAWRGRLVVIGFAAGRIPVIKANYLLVKNIEVSGLQVSDYRRRMPELLAEGFAEVFQLAAEGRIHPLPSETLPLSQWREAVARIEQRTTSARMILLPFG